ncbi:LLM class flavin-dependent oxidoreductase [Cellulomonas sp. ATA003]|uniref:LLM class flavin-dependent oxidoreductase n=1 Tax=Cellulomonas sp. ATA003 TaxID=3073064 RepID=UPI002873BDB3|nr:LLM class flavin-dependent oxidoreductase [Cellulomonas sp. ATA003]WNB86279.1 LLM class flavin-dependent oxidoreductase [Cellulomonas sp. ATA003]
MTTDAPTAPAPTLAPTPAPSDPSERTRVPLSVLDLSTVSDDATSRDALLATTELARAADRLGYDRFWVAEHHNMPAVASTSPAVLIAHLAASTDRIRVGSGGVMLPNHPPLVVGEQFAMLEALHPGRIDLGIGRAPGTDPATAAALRRTTDGLGAEDFPRELLDVLGLLGQQHEEDTGRPPSPFVRRFSATPAQGSTPQVWLLGSSTFSARLAAALGIRFAYAHHFGATQTMEAMAAYRAEFRPSAQLAAPHAMISASVILADSDDEARYLAGPSKVMSLSLRTGRLAPITDPATAAEVLAGVEGGPLEAVLAQLPGTQVATTTEQAVTELQGLVDRTRADELLVTATTHDIATRIDTLERLRTAWV